MAEYTPTSDAHFQQLRNRQNELYRANTAGLIKAAKAGDAKLIDKFRSARVELGKNDHLIFEAEQAFLVSDLTQSEAEKGLIQAAREANGLVRGIETTTQILNAVSKMAGILARLIPVLRGFV